ncbi:MAG: serine hydrolase, partial [Balneolaceae bacterium]|nr:serine hydrolase [Balneolaceae bacterium]
PSDDDSSRYVFPEETWILHSNPENVGWDTEQLAKVGHYADSLETAALMVVHKGVLVYDWGATDEKYITQSIRKGLLNSLYGLYWDEGAVNLNSTLNDLGVTDTPPLFSLEQSATIEQLLQSTSGVYHSALYEVGSWKENKPERGTHQPGEHWYYNNWGFNALGSIIEQISSQKIGDLFNEKIAVPLQMQDFEESDVTYITQNNWAEKMMGNESVHPAYMFSMSARDMARFGLLYLNEGAWNGNRILSEEWIKKSWTPVDIDMYQTLKFGYLWWMFEDGLIYVEGENGFEDDIYFTSGNRGHVLFVVPYLDLVVVHRVYAKGVGFWSQIKRGPLGIHAEVDDADIYKILDMIRQAHPYYNNNLRIKFLENSF